MQGIFTPSAIARGFVRALLATSLSSALWASGCVGRVGQVAIDARPMDHLVLDETAEHALTSANRRHGRLVLLHQPPSPRGVVVTVHGINASPSAMQPIHAAAVSDHFSLWTFVYDDETRTLHESASDFASAWTEHGEHFVGDVQLVAHSMGSRIVVAALATVAPRLLRSTRLTLFAPPLGGVAIADSAPFAPSFLADLPGVRPGVDMGTNSSFQTLLEQASLPSTVATTIYVGDRDHIVDRGIPGFDNVVRRLDADLILVPGAGHTDILQRFTSPWGAGG